MGERWKLDKAFGAVVITGVTNIYCDGNPNAEVAKMLHNADCDAYEARIAELEESLAKYAHAVHVGHPKPCDLGTLCPYCYIDHVESELARVRAESLRVVPVGAKVPLDELWCDEYLIQHDERVYIREYDTDNFVELSDGPCLDVPEDTIVHPVRLERWEDEG